MRFADWAFLILLGLLPLLHTWWTKRNKPANVRFSVRLPGGIGEKVPLQALLWIKYIGLALMILALARPQAGSRQTQRNLSGIDIMLVLDVSDSMNIEDLSERARIDIAKETMENFIKGRTNDRIGFVMFSGEPLTMAPPTLDYGLLLRSLHDATIGVLKPGTAIGDGLTVAVSHLRNSSAKSRVVILLTDGDNNVGQVDPATAGELAKGFGIKVYTIAIGREGRVKMPIRRAGIMGNQVTAYQFFDNALNPALLQQIAELTHGKFYRVTDESALTSVFSEIDRMETTEFKAKERVKYNELFDKPLKLGALVLVIGQILERGWWRILP